MLVSAARPFRIAGFASLIACAASAAPALGQVSLERVILNQGLYTSSGTPVSYDATPASRDFSTFDGQSGFTSSWAADGITGSFTSYATITPVSGGDSTIIEDGFNAYFTIPNGQTAILTPGPSTPYVRGVMWIANVDTNEYRFFYYTDTDPLPIVGQAEDLSAGHWHLFGVTLASLDANGDGGLRSMAVQLTLVPEPATLGALALLAPTILRRRRRRA